MKGLFNERKENVTMNDDAIVKLFFARDEAAIVQVQKQYGSLCHAVAMRILGSREDAEECVNDTLRRAWDTIPPRQPTALSAYLAMLTRHFALSRLKARMADKRGGGQMPLLLDELAECVADGEADEGQVEHLRDTLNAFLSTLPQKNRMIFVRRYWYTDSAADIAAAYGMNENSVNALLFRTRKKLKQYLHDAGIDV
jgi:RNA polymerase sigma-70 factor (ECF subfamily)